MQVVRSGDCATLANARVDVWQADAIGLYSGYANQGGVGGVSPESAVGKQYLRGTQVTDAKGTRSSERSSPAGTAAARHTCTSRCSWAATRWLRARSSFPTRSAGRVFAQWDAVSRACRQAKGLQQQRSDSARRVLGGGQGREELFCPGHSRGGARITDQRARITHGWSRPPALVGSRVAHEEVARQLLEGI